MKRYLLVTSIMGDFINHRREAAPELAHVSCMAAP
jgi:hypothetical protein